MALAIGAPTVVAENEPSVNDDGSVGMGTCVGVDPWQIPPGVYVDVDACLDGL